MKKKVEFRYSPFKRYHLNLAPAFIKVVFTAKLYFAILRTFLWKSHFVFSRILVFFFFLSFLNFGNV